VHILIYPSYQEKFRAVSDNTFSIRKSLLFSIA